MFEYETPQDRKIREAKEARSLAVDAAALVFRGQGAGQGEKFVALAQRIERYLNQGN